MKDLTIALCKAGLYPKSDASSVLAFDFNCNVNLLIYFYLSFENVMNRLEDPFPGEEAYLMKYRIS